METETPSAMGCSSQRKQEGPQQFCSLLSASNYSFTEHDCMEFIWVLGLASVHECGLCSLLVLGLVRGVGVVTDSDRCALVYSRFVEAQHKNKYSNTKKE